MPTRPQARPPRSHSLATATSHPLRLMLLVGFSLAVFLPFIGARDIATSHEARVVQVARQMAEVGWPWNARHVTIPKPELVDLPVGKRLRAVDFDSPTMSVNPWIIPVMNGQIRLQKPPLPYWCSAVLFRVFGFGEGVSRFVPALLGAIAVLLVWDLARILIGRIGAWYAAMVWLSSYFIVDEFRKTMADPYLAFFTLLATWAWIRASKRKDVRIRWLLLFYASLALAMLAKGPIILLFVVPYIVLYHALYRTRVPLNWLGHVLGLLIFVAISLPWYIAVWRSVPNALELWRYESIGELSDNTEKARGWWYYLPNVLQITLPWTPLWVMGLIYPWIAPNRSVRPKQRRRWFATAATVLIVFMFSLSFVKKNAYLLPLVPIQTIVVAQGLLWLTAIFRRDPKNRPVRVPLMRVAVLTIIFAIGVQVLVSIIFTRIDNNRSAKDVCRIVEALVDRSSSTSVLVSKLPEEASVYLPPDLRDSRTSTRVLLIADDHKDQADALVESIKTTPSGPVAAIVQVPIPNARSARWKLFSLTIGPQAAQKFEAPSSPHPTTAPASDPG